MRPGGKSNGESPFFEEPNLSVEGRGGILAAAPRLGRSCARNDRSSAARSHGRPRGGVACGFLWVRPVRRLIVRSPVPVLARGTIAN